MPLSRRRSILAWFAVVIMALSVIVATAIVARINVVVTVGVVAVALLGVLLYPLSIGRGKKR